MTHDLHKTLYHILIPFLSGIILITATFQALAQKRKISFESYGVAEGLPEESVGHIVQDDQGFIWFGTQNGLVKYDGYEFKTFRNSTFENQKEGLGFRMIRSLIKGKDGKLWMSSGIAPFGIASFNPLTEKFTSYLYNPDDPKSMPYMYTSLLFEDSRQNVWFLNSKIDTIILCRLDQKTQEIHSYPYVPFSRVNDILLALRFVESNIDSSIWLKDRSFNSDIRKWNRETDSFEVVIAANHPLPGLDITDTLDLMTTLTDGRILIGGYKGVYIWNPSTSVFDDHFEHDPDDPNSLLPDPVQYAFEDSRGYFWAIHFDKGITIIDLQNQIFTRYRVGENPLIFPHTPSKPSFEIKDGDVFFEIFATSMNDQGIWFFFNPNFGAYLYYDFASKSFQKFDQNFNEPTNQMYPQLNHNRFIMDHSGLAWLGFRPNLYREAPKRKIRELYTHDPDLPTGLPSNFITHLYEDRAGTFWVGTLQGLAYFDSSKNQFEVFQPNPVESPPLKGYIISQILEDGEGNLWIGTNKGLFSWNPKEKQFRLRSMLNKYFTSGLMIDKDQRLWVSTESKGVYVLDINTGKLLKKFLHNPQDSTSLVENFSLIKILQDSREQIWIAGFAVGGAGLYRVSEDENSLIPYKYIPDDTSAISFFEHIFIREDSKGRLWVGSDHGGLNLYDPLTDKFSHFHHPNNFNSISTFVEDQQGQIFAGSYSGGGLAQINPETKTLQFFGEKEGLLHNDIGFSRLMNGKMIYSHNRLWLPGSRGLSVFHTDTKEIDTYFEGAGFIPQEWPVRTPVFQTKDQSIWIGCKAGLYRIYPDQMLRKDSIPPKVVITNMNIGDQHYSAPDGEIFKQAVSYTKQIQLPHHQKDLTFEFVGLHYLDSKENQYSWKLEPYEKEWTNPSKERSVAYTNLDPGTYTFRVKASNADGTWNEEGGSMIIVISPPWWATWWARAFFIALILAIGYIIYKYQLGRQLEQAENQRLKELDNVKTRLYTNITHEFRTPLTVISGMTEQIKHPQAKKLIHRNSTHLLSLVNQMLDLSKLESGKLSLDLIQGNIITYLQYLAESFHSFAESKEIELVFYPEISALMMDYDDEKFQYIISNLLSNAIKFSPKSSKIILHTQQENQDGTEYLLLKVKDEGIGIPEDKLSHIFDRFYQVDDSATRQGEGTGIGLTLTRELVLLMGGSIEVESKVNEGSTFLVRLPVSRTATPAPEREKPINSAIPFSFEAVKNEGILLSTEDLPRILIIEDNPDVVYYIQSLLVENYQVMVAENGTIGIQKALEHTPDLIISDVMMPEKDGFEICQTLKQDERTSHVPIILLTAKADVESRIAGLQEGADAYLAKPFEKQELLVRIDQLIQLRRNLQSRYRELHGSPMNGDDKKYQREDGFVRKVKLIIEERLSDDQLSVDQLARDLGMSRSQLFRKLKALTSKSAVAFIRSYRLSRARQLLKTTDLSISEVAYEVGFNSPAHFSATFLKEYGVQPSETRK